MKGPFAEGVPLAADCRRPLPESLFFPTARQRPAVKTSEKGSKGGRPCHPFDVEIAAASGKFEKQGQRERSRPMGPGPLFLAGECPPGAAKNGCGAIGPPGRPPGTVRHRGTMVNMTMGRS
jgi:hypothetical protein